MVYVYVIISFCFVFSSCAVPREPERNYHSEFNACIENERAYQENLDQLEKELALKTEMLSRFNLVDEKGNLRTKLNYVDEKITGNELWQK